MERRFHLGLDYGTSSSKLILRELDVIGGTRAHLVRHAGSYRIPSAAAVSETHVELGCDRRPGPDWELIPSIKILAAHEAQRRSVPTTPGGGVTNGDLVTWSLWWLLSLGLSRAQDIAGTTRGANVQMDYFVGAPLSFLEDATLKRAFLGFAGMAGTLLKMRGPMQTARWAKAEVRAILDHVRATNREPWKLVPEHWVQPESKAAMWLAAVSPTIAAGPYAEVDIGAGTTHASFFRITDNRNAYKDAIHVFGAASQHVGMDDIAERISGGKPGTAKNMAVRGTENKEIAKPGIRVKCTPVMAEMFEALRRAWTEAGKRVNGFYERRNWRSIPMFVVGGGSLVRDVKEYFIDGAGAAFRPVSVPVPQDLAKAGVDESDLAFLQVSYGLSNPDVEFLDMNGPTKIRPMAEARREGTSDEEVACACRGHNEDCPRCAGTGSYKKSFGAGGRRASPKVRAVPSSSASTHPTGASRSARPPKKASAPTGATSRVSGQERSTAVSKSPPPKLFLCARCGRSVTLSAWAAHKNSGRCDAR